MQKTFSPLLQIGLCTFGYLYATSNTALAQVTSDGTVNTQVNQNGNVAEITGGETRGGNLFHSFQDFSVPTDNQAFFNNADSIANIFSRVTGGRISDIDGTIRANGSASLFLINPAGIIFGQNARLDIGGSFYGSTASSILFEDGEFSAADLENPPILTVNAPIGLGFRDEPGDIVNRSVADNTDFVFIGLRLQPGADLTFVGGDIKFDSGFVTVPGGKVELGGVSEAGIVEINEDGSLSFPDNVARADVSFDLAQADVRSGGGGSITINARNIELSDETYLLAGISSGLGTPEAQAGDITLNATEAITAIDSSLIENNVKADAIGNSGNVNIITKNLSLANRTRISSSTEGQGNAGSVLINATENVSFDGGSGTFSQVLLEEAIGNGGSINITTKNLSLTNTGVILAPTFGIGNAGNIIVNATETISLDSESFISSGIFLGGRGETGNIEINATNLEVNNGSRLTSSNFDGQGNGGNVIINASETVFLDGGEIESGVGDNATGNGGSISITSKKLSLANNAEINSNTFGLGDAGDIFISASELVEVNESVITAQVRTEAQGDGGNLNIKTTNLSLTEDAGLTISNQGQGNAGNITITADNLTLDRNNSISGSTVSGTGGIVNLQIAEDLILRRGNEISAQAVNNANGGNLNIDSRFIIAFPNGNNDILADAERGQGGNIDINAESLFGIQERTPSDSTNDINASSEFSLDGSVTINTPDINPVQGATELPRNVIEPGETTTQACQANREIAAQNGLNITGKGGIPAEPGLPLDSQNVSINGETNPTSAIPEPIETSQGKIQPARGIKVTESGEIILTAYRTNNSGERIPEIKPNCS